MFKNSQLFVLDSPKVFIKHLQCYLPNLIRLNDGNLIQLVRNQLSKFDEIPDVIGFNDESNFRVRIVHFYNAFQNCLNNIIFLAQIFDLSEHFNADLLVTGLQGTFIYNLTVKLGNLEQQYYPDPFDYLIDEIFGKSMNHSQLLKDVAKFVLIHCERKMDLPVDINNSKASLLQLLDNKKKENEGKAKLFSRAGRQEFSKYFQSNIDKRGHKYANNEFNSVW